MAKKSNLFGRADASLVGAAYREGMTRGPGDLSGVYELQAQANNTMWEMIGQSFDKVFGDTIALNEKFEQATDDIMAEFNSGTAQDYEAMRMYDVAVQDIRQRLKGTKKNSLEERELYNELERLKNSTDNYRQTIVNIGNFVKNRQHNPMATGAENLEVLTAIFEKRAKRKIENGNLMISATGEEGTYKDWKELQKAVIIKDHGNEAALIERGNDGFTLLKNNPKMSYDKEMKDSNINWIYKNSFKTLEAFADLADTRIDFMPYSLVEAMNGKDPKMKATIQNALQNINSEELVKDGLDVSGPNGKKDNKITWDDFKGDNAKKLISALTNIHDDNFDFEAAKKIAAEFYEEHLMNPYAKRGIDNRSVKPPPTGTEAERKRRQQLLNIKTAFQGSEIQSFSLDANRRVEFDPNTRILTEITGDGRQQISAQKMLDLMFKAPGLYDANKVFEGINFATPSNEDETNPIIYYSNQKEKNIRYNDFTQKGDKWFYPDGERVKKQNILDKLNSIFV